MQYIKNFTKERSNKIGASDISKLIQHPEKSESLYGYDETALTLWQEKTGKIHRKESENFRTHCQQRTSENRFLD